jgi:molybdopterin-guanine dinucleotide biosynthesis protein
VKKQLVKSLDAMLQEQTRMLIIIGSQSSGKTTLAKEMALFLYKAGKLKSSKMAKITAEKLNDIEVLSKKDRLRDCCLLIEHAGKLKRKTIEGILDLASILQEDVAVIFEEEENHLNQLFKEYPKLMDLVQNRIHLM